MLSRLNLHRMKTPCLGIGFTGVSPAQVNSTLHRFTSEMNLLKITVVAEIKIELSSQIVHRKSLNYI